MKNPLLTLLVLSATLQSGAQAVKKDFMVIPLLSQQSFYLKSNVSANDKSSHEVLQVNLPANTVEWFYTIITKSGHGEFSNNDLTGQLVKLVDPDLGIPNNGSILVPAGTGTCDVYLMTNPLELHKYINRRHAASFLMNDSREPFVSGAVSVKDFLDGSCYLIVRNPSASHGINVNIEVTAIVLSSPVGSSTAMQ
ncbi:MAG TPA: hypothetical protein VGI38_10920 [Puia sp.]